MDFSRSSRSFHNVFRLSFSRLISKQLKIVNFAVYQKLYFEACRDVPNFLLSIALLLHCDIYVLIWKHVNVYFIQISFNNKPQLIYYTPLMSHKSLNSIYFCWRQLFLFTGYSNFFLIMGFDIIFLYHWEGHPIRLWSSERLEIFSSNICHLFNKLVPLL